MDPMVATILLLLSVVFLCKLVSTVVLAGRYDYEKHKKKLPPSPPSLPIVGHLHLLRKPLLHVTLARLASLHGPVLFLRFGSRPVLVVSCASTAEECFTTNDVVFANRPKLVAVKYQGANLIWSSYGSHWRNLRRISTVEIFSSHRLQSFSGIRMEEVKRLVSRLHRDCGRQGMLEVELKTRIFELAYNVMMRITMGKSYYEDKDVKEAQKFKSTVEHTLRLASLASAHLGDYLPWLRWVDLNGTESKMADVKRRRNAFLRALIDERRGDRTSRRRADDAGCGRPRPTDILDVLLDQPEFKDDDDIIIGSLMDILLGGMESTMVTMEWAMSLLLNHPKAMERAREEISSQVGWERIVDDADVPRLPYLQAIINETLRLYPTGPLLVPHESSEDTVVGGYDVPKGTMLLVNVYAIQRDEKLWESATKFVPERFLPTQDGNMVVPDGCKFFPFGFGRRRCPGEGMAMKHLGLALGALIQCFRWEKVEGALQQVDMTEGDGIALFKAAPLHVMCEAREEMLHLLS